MVESHWPEPFNDTDDGIERDLFRQTLAAFPEMIDINASERVEITVAPDWKYRDYKLACWAGNETGVVESATSEDALAR